MPPPALQTSPGAPPEPGAHFRRGLGLRKQIIGPLTEDYRGHLVRFARDHDYRIRAGDFRFVLAREFGFCYGVDRAIEYAYEARARFPDRRIFLVGEIIHNPYVNRRLRGFGIRIVEDAPTQEEKFAAVERGDVVLLPAFGVAVNEQEFLRKRGAVLVDTTCGSVMNVWKNVGRYRREGFTSIVHGKWKHEETRATVSRAGSYLVVRDFDEAEDVCRYIEAGAGAAEAPFDREGFLSRHAPHACSDGFDPDTSLGRIGLANQTTMLATESLRIADRFSDAIGRRYGAEALPSRFRHFDTICSATQERQDAVIELLEHPLDLMLVIGGFNSSNTSHLAEICSERFPTYHIAGPACLRSDDEIRHRRPTGSIVMDRGWLPRGPVTIGVTSGASTPDVMVHRSLARVLGFRGLTEDDCRGGLEA